MTGVEFIQNDPVVTKVTTAVFVPAGSGAPVHKLRSAHGLAFNVDHTTTYRFQDGQVLHCGSGACIYLPQGSTYTVDKTAKREDAGAGVYCINFLLAEPVGDKPCVIQVRGYDGLLSHFMKAEKAWRQKAPGFREEAFSRLYSIFWGLQQEQQGISQRDKALAALAPALSYINDHYTQQNIELADLARLCGVSQPYLRRLFQAAFRVPPAVYVRNKRLKYAKELLSTGEYSVTDASVLAGFNDTAYFSREFKSYTGMTPSEYSKNGSI